MRVVPSSSGQNEGGPPAHWQQLLNSGRRGPPADWVERVRRGAPHLLEGLDLGDEQHESPPAPPQPAPRPPPRVLPRRGGASSRPGPKARPSSPASLPLPVPGDSWPVQPTAPREEERTTPSEVRSAPVPPSTPRPRAGVPLLRPARERGSEVSAPGSWPREARGRPSFPRHEESTPRVIPTNAREDARSTRARGPSPTERTPNPAPVPRPYSGAHGDARVAPSLSPSPHVPARNALVAPGARSSSFLSSEPTPHEAPLPREKGRVETPFSLDRASPFEISHPWPEPPELPSTEPTEPLAVLRDWERLRRLEREQRGE